MIRLTKRLAVFCPCRDDVPERHDRLWCSSVNENRARGHGVVFLVGRCALAYLVVGSPRAIRLSGRRNRVRGSVESGRTVDVNFKFERLRVSNDFELFI